MSHNLLKNMWSSKYDIKRYKKLITLQDPSKRIEHVGAKSSNKVLDWFGYHVSRLCMMLDHAEESLNFLIMKPMCYSQLWSETSHTFVYEI